MPRRLSAIERPPAVPKARRFLGPGQRPGLGGGRIARNSVSYLSRAACGGMANCLSYRPLSSSKVPGGSGRRARARAGSAPLPQPVQGEPLRAGKGDQGMEAESTARADHGALPEWASRFADNALVGWILV